MAMKTNRKLQEDFEPQALPEGLTADPHPPRARSIPHLVEEPKIRKQYRLQKIMLDAILINRAHFASETDLSVADQKVVEENPVQAKQAAAQEKGGSVFSSAYDGRFFGLV